MIVRNHSIFDLKVIRACSDSFGARESYTKMPKTNVIIFMESCDDTAITPMKIGNSYLNFFVIDEDTAVEILEIYPLKKSSKKMTSIMSRKYKDEKEDFDFEIIKAGTKKAAENQSADYQTLLIYAGYDYQYSSTLMSMVLNGMRSYRLRSATLTKLCRWRSHLVTKEQMEEYYKGQSSADRHVFDLSVSASVSTEL